MTDVKSSNERVSDARLEHLIRIAEMDCRKTSILLKDGGYSEGNIPAAQLRALTELRERRAVETSALQAQAVLDSVNHLTDVLHESDHIHLAVLWSEIERLRGSSPVEPTRCIDCGVSLVPEARHFSGCKSHPGERAVKARAPLRDSDAAFNLGVLPTEQPEKSDETK